MDPCVRDPPLCASFLLECPVVRRGSTFFVMNLLVRFMLMATYLPRWHRPVRGVVRGTRWGGGEEAPMRAPPALGILSALCGFFHLYARSPWEKNNADTHL